MTSDLRALRHEVYEASGKYHLAHSEFFNSFTQNNQAGVVKAAIKARAAGVFYKSALEKLTNYLTAAGLATVQIDELLRAMQTMDILDKEMTALSSCPQDEGDDLRQTVAQE